MNEQPLYPQEFDPSKPYGDKYTATSEQAARLAGIQLARIYLPPGTEVMVCIMPIPHDDSGAYVGVWRYPVDYSIVPKGFEVWTEKT